MNDGAMGSTISTSGIKGAWVGSSDAWVPAQSPTWLAHAPCFALCLAGFCLIRVSKTDGVFMAQEGQMPHSNGPHSLLGGWDSGGCVMKEKAVCKEAQPVQMSWLHCEQGSFFLRDALQTLRRSISRREESLQPGSFSPFGCFPFVNLGKVYALSPQVPCSWAKRGRLSYMPDDVAWGISTAFIHTALQAALLRFLSIYYFSHFYPGLPPNSSSLVPPLLLSSL